MHLDPADQNWLQNRLLDLSLLVIISLLVVPVAVFHVMGDQAPPRWAIVFGCMIPEYLCVGLCGIGGLLQHKRAQWKYPNPQKIAFLTLTGLFLIFESVFFIRATFFPTLLDSIVFLMWNMNSGTGVDFENTGLCKAYVFGIVPAAEVLILLVIVTLDIGQK